MESLKAFMFGPDPKVQAQKCNSILNANARALNRDILKLKQAENTARSQILAASKRAQKTGTKQAQNDVRVLAKGLVRARKQQARLATSKAQIESVRMQVKEAFAVRKIEASLKTSTSIMKSVNTLVKLPELSLTMRQLSEELMKAGIIEEMVGDMLPDEELGEEEDEEVEAEVDKVLGEVLKTPSLPNTQIGLDPEPAEEVDEDQEATLQQMRGRLEALKS